MLNNQQQQSLEIANIIKQQIMATGQLKVMSWGAKEFVAINNGLKFKVNGHHFKGYVLVTYDESYDLYTIVLGKIVKMEWKEMKKFEGVYCDQMADMIDGEIEYIPTYKR